MIRAVLFDFGGVLTETPWRMVQVVADACGATLAELGALLAGPYGEDGDHPWHRLERGEIPFAELCRWASEEGSRRGWRLDLAPFPELLRELAVRPRVVARVRELREAGYKTAMVTNNVREFRSAWEARFPLGELFDAVVDSCEVGLRKPDPRIYVLALERLGGVSPADAVLLDDFEVNLVAARRFGMRGILVGEDWQAALDELDGLLRAPAPLA